MIIVKPDNLEAPLKRLSDTPPMQHHPLRIVHCFRSPVGGIFRHVRDLIDEQVSAGHELGVICDNNTGGIFEETMLADLQTKLSLGLHRLPMNRAVTLSDAAVMARLYRTVSSLDLDVLHSHGAKGGAYSRLIGTALAMRNKAPARLYCPHGGSMHFASTTLSGRIYFMLERALERVTDQLIFVSNYERDAYLSKVGEPNCAYSVVRNGLRPEEFAPVRLNDDAADFLYIGMMRDLKGVDVLLDAIDLAANAAPRRMSIAMVGDGPDLETYKKRAAKMQDRIGIRFHDPMPAREAFALGKTAIVPSRAESMPYIVLEALAAAKPLIATAVGGIPEIYGPDSDGLVPPGDAKAMSGALLTALEQEPDEPLTQRLLARLSDGFSTATMARDVMVSYDRALVAQS